MSGALTLGFWIGSDVWYMCFIFAHDVITQCMHIFYASLYKTVFARGVWTFRVLIIGIGMLRSHVQCRLDIIWQQIVFVLGHRGMLPSNREWERESGDFSASGSCFMPSSFWSAGMMSLHKWSFIIDGRVCSQNLRLVFIDSICFSQPTFMCLCVSYAWLHRPEDIPGFLTTKLALKYHGEAVSSLLVSESFSSWSLNVVVCYSTLECHKLMNHRPSFLGMCQSGVHACTCLLDCSYCFSLALRLLALIMPPAYFEILKDINRSLLWGLFWLCSVSLPNSNLRSLQWRRMPTTSCTSVFFVFCFSSLSHFLLSPLWMFRRKPWAVSQQPAGIVPCQSWRRWEVAFGVN